jgi:hypothetical protein
MKKLFFAWMFLVLASVVSAEDFNLTKNLVAHWTFDQNASAFIGAIQDIKGNGTSHFNMTKYGGSCWSSGLNGKINKSWQGTGAVKCYMYSTFALSLGHKYSFCEWRNQTAYDSSGSTIFDSQGAQGNIIFFDKSTGKWYTNEGGTSYTHCDNLVTVNDGKWHFWCSTRNDTTLKVYYDTVNFCNATLAGNADFTIMEANGWSADQAYDLIGRIDSTSVWKGRVLNQSGINFLYNKTQGKSLSQYCNISGPPSITHANLSFVFKNLSGAQKINFTGLIDEPFRIYANYSFSNGSVALGSCRAKSNFRTYVFQTGVFTLCDSGCSNSSYFINKTDLPVSNGDYLIIEACYLGNARQIFNVSLCGSKYILGNSFPLCSQGYGLRRLTSSGGSSCNAKNYLWFNITSYILNSENSPLWINRLILERKINNQWQNLIYNAVNKMYESNVSIIQDVLGDNNPNSVNSYRNFTVNCSSGIYNNSKVFLMRIYDVSKPQIFVKHFSQGGSEYYSGILYNVSNGVINTSYYYSDAFVNYAVSDLECTVTYLNAQENWTVNDRYKNIIYQAVSNPSHQATYCGGNVVSVSFNASVTPVNFSLVVRDNWNVTNAKSFLVNYCKENWYSFLANSSCNGSYAVEKLLFDDSAGCGSSVYLPLSNGSVNRSFYCCIPNWLNYTFNKNCNGTFASQMLFYRDNNSCSVLALPLVPVDNGTFLGFVDCYVVPPRTAFDSVNQALLFFFLVFLWLVLLVLSMVLTGSHGEKITLLGFCQFLLSIALGLMLGNLRLWFVGTIIFVVGLSCFIAIIVEK